MSTVLKDAWRLLTFRSTTEEIHGFGNAHLIFGLISTWIVGMGRWWDDPKANLLQHIGLGSVVYVFVLALLLFLVMAPLRPANWSYKSLLTFVTLTSPPAVFYAIPVERFMELDQARMMNIGFLTLVATWRMALLFFYLKRSAQLATGAVLAGAIMPVTAIIVALSMLNMERVLVNIMAGLHNRGNANDAVYETVGVIAALSLYAFPICLIYWIILVVRARHKKSD